MNLQKVDGAEKHKYLTLNDFSFFWAIANTNRVTVQSAHAICKIMEIHMLKRDFHFQVAEKVFFKLAGKFADEPSICSLIADHAS